MKHLKRFLATLACFSISMIVIHTMRAPQRVPYTGYRVACMPLDAAKRQNADWQLMPYAQIAHKTFESTDNSSAYRCYFRFAPRDVVCVPKAAAVRKNVQLCPRFPTIDGSQKKQCYILNEKLIPLTKMLEKQPAVGMQAYMPNQNNVVKKWQQVRDLLLGKK